MTRDEYWQAHVAKNPALADESAKVTLTVNTLKRLMDEAFDKGFDRGKHATTILNELFPWTK